MITNNQGEWNLDVGELEYNPTLRDMNDAKFRHLLANSDYKPIRRVRQGLQGDKGYGEAKRKGIWRQQE